MYLMCVLFFTLPRAYNKDDDDDDDDDDKKQPACGQQSRLMWRCVLNATVPESDHRAFFRHLC